MSFASTKGNKEPFIKYDYSVEPYVNEHVEDEFSLPLVMAIKDLRGASIKGRRY